MTARHARCAVFHATTLPSHGSSFSFFRFLQLMIRDENCVGWALAGTTYRYAGQDSKLQLAGKLMTASEQNPFAKLSCQDGVGQVVAQSNTPFRLS